MLSTSYILHSRGRRTTSRCVEELVPLEPRPDPFVSIGAVLVSGRPVPMAFYSDCHGKRESETFLNLHGFLSVVNPGQHRFMRDFLAFGLLDVRGHP